MAADVQKVDLADIDLNTGNVFRSFLSHAIGLADNKGDAFGVSVYRNGQAVDLNGVTVQGFFRNPQGTNIAITTGYTVTDNKAYIELPQACYTYEGTFTLAIKLIGGGVTGTVRIVDGIVSNTNATGTVVPTETVPTYQEIIAQFDDMVAATQAANASIADDYAQATANDPGSYVIKDGAFYVLPSGHNAGATWANTTKTETKVGPELAAANKALFASFGLSHLASVIYNYGTKSITFPDGFLYRNGAGTAKSTQTIDVSDVLNTEACIFWVKTDGTIYAKAWNTGSDAASDRFLGYIFRKYVHIIGVNPEQTKIVDSSGGIVDGTWFSPALIGIAHNVGNVIYNYTDKVLKIPGSGFTVHRGKSITRSSQVTIDVTNALRSEACSLFVNDAGTIYAADWMGCNANSQKDQIVGYIYRKNVVIFGVNPDQISVVDESTDLVYCFGDSIVAGVGSTKLFHMYWHEWEPDTVLYNWGIGSTGYVTETSSTVYVGGGTEGRGTSQSQSGNNNVLKVMQGVSATMPNIVISAGTNDYGGNTPIATFRTAVQNTLDYALTKTPNVFVMTPIKRTGWATSTNTQGLHLKDYADVIIEECEARGITYAEGYGVSIDPSVTTSKNAFIPDGLHPNEAGHDRLARFTFSRFLEGICK